MSGLTGGRTYAALLHDRGYRLWFLSGLWSGLGDWVGLFALQVLVVSLAEPGSPLALFGLGSIMLARLLPSVVFGPVAAALVDRLDRKRLMVLTNLGRAALFAGIAFSRDLVALLALTFVVECLSLAYLSARNAVLPALARREHLTEANQLNLLVTYGPLPFGAGADALLSALGGWMARAGLTGLEPTTVPLLVNAVTFLAAAVLVARMPLPARARGGLSRGGGQPLAQLREGMRFINEQRLIRSLILGVVGVFFGAGVIMALGPVFVQTDLGRSDADWYGLITTVGLGLLLGIAGASLLAARVAKERLFAISLSLASALALIMATLPGYRVVQIAGFLLGTLAGVSFVTGYTLLHERTRDEVRARTFAVFYTTTRLALFAALGLAPFVAGGIGTITLGPFEISGVRLTILLGGVVALASALPAGLDMVRSGRRQRRELR